MAATPSKAKLRQLLLQFYQKNDPVVLQQGLDISGLVDFATEKGVNVLNGLLMRKYGKTINVDDANLSAKDKFAEIRTSFSPSAKIVEKEHEYRMKLFNFFSNHDPDMVDQSRARQFEKFVKFAMLNGLDKLSEKLKQKYGAGVDDSGYAPPKNDFPEKEDAFEMVESGLNPFNLDTNRLRRDMEDFYIYMEDDEQVEVLDETVDWACEIGIDEFNSKLEQLYGTSLNKFLEQSGRPIHVNQVQTLAPPPSVPVAAVYEEEEDDDDETQYETIEEQVEVPNTARPFEAMSDNDIIAELHAFYSQHDEDNLANLDKVLELSRRIGREALNKHLMQIYEDKLSPIPATTTKTVKKQVKVPKKPRQPKQRVVPELPPGLPARNVPELPDRRELPPLNNSPPSNRVTDFDDSQAPPINNRFNTNPNQQNDAFKEAIGKAVQNPNMKHVEPVQQLNREEEEDKNVPEFMRKWKGMNKRINDGKARVRDGRGGVIEINILIDVCKNYRMDPTTGICTCGFAKNDHWYVAKK